MRRGGKRRSLMGPAWRRLRKSTLTVTPLPAVRPQCLGMVWYEEEQWARILELAADAANLHKDYADWLSAAERQLEELAALGIDVVKVQVDVEEMAAWCRDAGRPFDGASRSDFVARKLEEQGGVLEP